jgi:hypothetical protein
MAKYYTVNLNTVRNPLLTLSAEQRLAETRRSVKMLLVPRQAKEPISDAMIPDYLVTDGMVERFLEISPPIASIIPEFQEIINEIEIVYVRAEFFSAVSSACVTTERLLNFARMKLHEYHLAKKELWDKGALNDWDRNIDALREWGYLDGGFADELKKMYTDIRCKYLHSGDILNIESDARTSVNAAYKLLKIFLGFPEYLFEFTSGINCKNENDPRFKAFYLPNIREEAGS